MSRLKILELSRFAIGAAVVLRGNELAVPAQDRVGRDDAAAC